MDLFDLYLRSLSKDGDLDTSSKEDEEVIKNQIRDQLTTQLRQSLAKNVGGDYQNQTFDELVGSGDFNDGVLYELGETIKSILQTANPDAAVGSDITTNLESILYIIEDLKENQGSADVGDLFKKSYLNNGTASGTPNEFINRFVTVRKTGKEIFITDAFEADAINCTCDSDITRSGNLYNIPNQVNVSNFKKYDLPVALPAGTYTFTADITTNFTGTRSRVIIGGKDLWFNITDGDASGYQTFTITSPATSFTVYSANGNVSNPAYVSTYSNIMITKGSATSKLPYEEASGEVVYKSGETVKLKSGINILTSTNDIDITYAKHSNYVEALVSRTDDLIKSFITNTKNGSSIVIDDSIEGNAISCECDSPITRTGINLIDVPDHSFTWRDVITFDEPIKISSGEYTLSGDFTSNAGTSTMRIDLTTNYRDVTASIPLTTEFKTISFNNDDIQIQKVTIYSGKDGATSQNKTAGYSNIMLIKGQSTTKPIFNPYEKDVYNVGEVVKLKSYTNILNADTPIKISYVKNTPYITSLLSGTGGIEKLTGELLGYITPEMFGASGNNINDDTESLQNCINYGFEKKIPVKAYGIYKTTSPIIFDGEYGNIEINEIVNTNSSQSLGGIVIQCKDTYLKLESITTNGDGIVVKGGRSRFTERNRLDLGIIKAGRHGIRFTVGDGLTNQTSYAWSNTFNFRCISAGGDHTVQNDGTVVFSGCYGIYKDGGTATEMNFNGGQITNCEWAVKDCNGWRFNNLHIETKVDGGFYFNEPHGAIIYQDRHAEANRDGLHPFIKLGREGVIPKSDNSGVFNNIKYINGVYLPVNEIDLTDMPTVVYNADETGTNLVTFATHGELDVRIGSAVYQDEDGKITSEFKTISDGAIIWGKKLICKPLGEKSVDITNNTDLRGYASKEHPERVNQTLPTEFVIKNTARIDLNESYIFCGINSFIVDQTTDGAFATIYDYDGNLVFNGETKGKGKYKITQRIKSDGYIFYQNANVNFAQTNLEWVCEEIPTYTLEEFEKLRRDIDYLSRMMDIPLEV